MIPGSNLLKAAFKIIAKNTVQYYRNTGRTASTVGTYVAAYASPVAMQGSVQAVPRSRYAELELDLSKDYITFYTMNNILGLEREVAGDKLVWNGREYACESPDDWYAQDGWMGVLCIDVGPAT